MSFEGLPERLAEIAGIIGLEGALLLAEARGGARVSIPSNPKPDSPITQILGIERARLLAEYYTAGGTSGELLVPLGPSGSYLAARRARARAIAALLDEGVSQEEIARRLHITSRAVLEHAAKRAGRRGDRRQQELF